MMSTFTRTAFLAAASTLAIGAAAQAQVFEQVGGGDRRTVDTITVTAQQREESSQDVPLSIGAYDTDALENAGVSDIKDLISIAPGLMVTSTQSETITTARIRGIGTVGDNFGLESSVGVYIDGVFRSRNGVGFGDLGEIDRIEVLRGPQGTLFGKNTSAGVLNVVTASPEFEYGGALEATVGDYGYNRFTGSLTGPLIEDVLAFRLFAAKGERDGFQQLILDDGNGPAEVTESETQDYYTIRAQALWTPSETVEGRVIMDYSTREELCCSAVQWDYAATPAAFVNAVGGQVLQPANPEARVAYANREYEQNIDDRGISAEFDIEMPIGTLTSVTAWREWSNSRTQDIDYSTADIAYRADGNFTDLTRFSQEVRLTGIWGDLDWLVGGFLSHEELELGDAIRYGDDWEGYLGRLLTAGSVPPLGTPAGVTAVLSQIAPLAPVAAAIGVPGAQGFMPVPPPGAAIPAGTGTAQDLYDQTAESWAIFTHNTYRLTDNLALTAGLRYTHETKNVFATFDTNSPAACGALETAFGPDPVSGLVAAASAAGLPASSISGLATAAGNICLPYGRTALDQTGYDRERTDEQISGTIRLTYDFNDDIMGYAGYSRGFKAGGFNLDRSFNGPLDGALGYTDVDSGFAPEIIDAYEIGFKSQLFGNVLQLNANAFYQEVEDFQLNTFTGISFVVNSIESVESYGVEIDFAYATPIDGLDITGGYAYVNAEYGNEASTAPNLRGKQISLSPENFLTAQVIYERPLFGEVWGLASLDARYVSDYNTGSDLDPEKLQESFTLLNARVGLNHADGRWSIEAWGRNLTDEAYAQVAFDQFAQSGGFGAFMGAPRTWGVTLRTEW
ncbi:TonB-dependent receptor [Oceanicaulis sp. MMSF_3324]|uniref:TonB-dependent receptor n=1 Tax=Oceanicaulis sp. MMSF_3324 TaxID=3046702 RepID=UPI00273D4BA0|nr:TonB-dependent receptor [Oceanicaulis sp. MMSF_3324]